MWKPSINTEARGTRTQGVVFLGFQVATWMTEQSTTCMWMHTHVHLCVYQQSVMWGVKARSSGGLTSLHQHPSEAMSLSRYTSSLENAASLQNKHTSHLLLSLTGKPSGARRGVKEIKKKKEKMPKNLTCWQRQYTSSWVFHIMDSERNCWYKCGLQLRDLPFGCK